MPEKEHKQIDTVLEGVITLYQEGKIVGFLVKERETGRSVFYKPTLMKMDEVAALINPGHNNV